MKLPEDLKKARRQGLLLEVTASVDSVERSKPWLVAMRSEPVESKEVSPGNSKNSQDMRSDSVTLALGFGALYD